MFNLQETNNWRWWLGRPNHWISLARVNTFCNTKRIEAISRNVQFFRVQSKVILSQQSAGSTSTLQTLPAQVSPILSLTIGWR